MAALLIELHLKDCPECFRRADDLFFKHNGFRLRLDDLGSFKLDHPAQDHLANDDRLDAYLTGRISDFHKEDVELHCRMCRKCRRMVARGQKVLSVRDVRVNDAAVSLKPTVGFSQPATWTLGALLIGVLLALVLWAILRAPGRYDDKVVGNSETGGAQQEAHQGPDSPTDDRTPTTPTPKNNVTTKEKQRPRIDKPRNQLSSINGLFIARAYEIKKPSNLPGDESDENLDEQERGTAVEGTLTKRWRIVGPMMTLVRSATPWFRWTSTERADSYEVSIYDDSFNLIDSSGPVRTTWWRTRKPLERGRLYRWMVTAEKDGKEIFAAPPRGAAFRIIEAAESIDVQRKLRGTHSSAVRGLIYAEAGLLDDAEIELQRHLNYLPYDKQAKKLIKTIRSWRN
jgi:hypothetical protein